jgi:hypothetical protein
MAAFQTGFQMVAQQFLGKDVGQKDNYPFGWLQPQVELQLFLF